MNKKILILIAVLIGFITILGLSLDLIAPDAALYGSISKLMYESGDFVNLYSLGTDWLDKPHLPFWITASSFTVFGVTNFAYKIPGVLLFFFACWVTYKFAKSLYNKEIAILSALILATSFHSVVSNFDVRAEPYLTAFIVASVYWFYKYVQHKKFSDLLIGTLFCAFAIMTKGIFAAIPVAVALGGHFIVTRNWKDLFNPMWLVALVLLLVFVIPEFYVLYQQFDVHPEKIVFGKTDVSGIKFFFWDSQFGRFFNTAPIKGKGDVLFFTHTILWAFLPWAILFYMAVFLKLKRNIPKLQKGEEFYTIFAALVTIVIFSVSKFQLPHYTNIIFPFMAIITADFIVRLKNQYKNLIKTFSITQYVLMGISLVLIVVLSVLMKPEFNFWFVIVVLFCGYALWQIKALVKNKIDKIVLQSAVMFCLLYGFMMTHFYPTLLQYQGDVTAARFANKNYVEDIHVLQDTKSHFFGFEFYHDKPVKRVFMNDIRSNSLFFVNQMEYDLLQENNISFSVENTFDSYRITKLKGSFLDANKRNKTLDKRYFIRLN